MIYPSILILRPYYMIFSSPIHSIPRERSSISAKYMALKECGDRLLFNNQPIHHNRKRSSTSREIQNKQHNIYFGYIYTTIWKGKGTPSKRRTLQRLNTYSIRLTNGETICFVALDKECNPHYKPNSQQY